MAKVTIDSEKCKGCGLCVSVCPKKLLVIVKDKRNHKGYCPAEMTDTEKCIGCAMCFTMCPDCALTVEK